jgi:hypothetical protein
MRIDQGEAPSSSTAKKSWGPAADAPTYLPADTFDEALGCAPLPPPPQAPVRAARGSQPRSDSVLTSAPRPSPGVVSGEVQARPSVPSLQRAPEVSPRASAPVMAAQPSEPVMAMPPYVPMDGGASFDPLAMPLPPELAPSIYDWLRRLALQTELAGADRLLRDALADLTSSLSVVLIYSGDDGLHTLVATDELPADQTPIAAVGKARRAIATSHCAYVPIATTAETIAVIQLVRNPRQQGFTMIDHVLMAGIARECAAIMHHLVVQHGQRRSEAEQDKQGLYRAEALDSHRRRGAEGALTELSPGWVRVTYKVLIAAIVIAAACAYFIEVPTYSSGTGVVVFDGTPITAPAPGTVETIYAQPAQQVRKGDLLVKLKADKEESDLEQARAELDAALHQYLIDRGDETLKKTLISAQAQTRRAEDALEQKTVRATADGTVSDIRIRAGSALEFGAPILTIVAPGTEPEMWAYLPGSDRPRLRPGQTLQIELLGYQKTRERATIQEVGRNVISAVEAKRSLGAELADVVRLPQDGSFVVVKAKLPRRTFRARGRSYNYHPGMPAKTEVRVESKRFVVTLLPSLEKYLE